MANAINTTFRNLMLFCFGGLSYFGIELLWRGYSHPSMLILGGLCFILVGGINEFLTFDMSLTKQSCIGAVIITVCEFFAGLLINGILGLEVWNYSDMPLNLWGQICLAYSIGWIFISALAIIVDDGLRHLLFDDEKPHYTLF